LLRLSDHVTQVVDEHAEEANEVVGRAIWEMTQIVSQGHSALGILAVCRRLGQDLESLGGKVSRPLIGSLNLDKKTQVIVKNIGSHVETIQSKAPQWKAELDKATELRTHWKRNPELRRGDSEYQ
jgi:DNA-binding IclR family transcriptional regulator